MKKHTSSYQKLFRATLATTMATGVLVAAVPTQAEAAKSFPDVKPTHHFYEAILNLTERGVINGYEMVHSVQDNKLAERMPQKSWHWL